MVSAVASECGRFVVSGSLRTSTELTYRMRISVCLNRPWAVQLAHLVMACVSWLQIMMMAHRQNLKNCRLSGVGGFFLERSPAFLRYARMNAG